MILVTGATGNVGRPMVRKLLERSADVSELLRMKIMGLMNKYYEAARPLSTT